MAMGSRSRIAGVCPPISSPDLDAAITFGDLDQLFRIRGVSVLGQPGYFQRVPEEQRRHQRGRRAAAGAAGGGPAVEPAGSARSAGWTRCPAVARAVAVDRLDLGFVDILSTEGIAGPPALGAAGRAVLAAGAAGQQRAAAEPAAGGRRRRWSRASAPPSRSSRAGFEPTPQAVRGILDADRPRAQRPAWDCRACGFDTCRRFAEAAALGRATLRQCTPYQERRAEEAQSGGGGGRADGALDLPRAAGPAGVRGGAEQAQQRGVRGAVPRPRPVQAGERPATATRPGNDILRARGGRDQERGARVGRRGALWR